MKMSRCLRASILLLLSLEAAALLVAGVDMRTIRLPGDTDTEVAAEAKRPWKCCDKTRCTRSIPPTCSCLDEVDKCPAACKSCAVSPTGRFVCNDQFRGDPGPICRPWKCCDGGACTKSIPPICRCGDEVDECAANCKSCVPSATNPSRFVCRDTYRGDIAPMDTRVRSYD